MFPRGFIFVFVLFFKIGGVFGQDLEKVDSITKEPITELKDLKIKGKLRVGDGIYDPLRPSRAAFYSAIFPGLGQIYNRRYWKAPIVWGALAIPAYYHQLNNSEYKRFRLAYRLRRAGLQDEFTRDDGTEIVSLETLERAQEQTRENRDMSLLTGVVLYILQIVEASVNAHLIQFNTDDSLTLAPTIIQDPFTINSPTVGLKLNITF